MLEEKTKEESRGRVAHSRETTNVAGPRRGQGGDEDAEQQQQRGEDETGRRVTRAEVLDPRGGARAPQGEAGSARGGGASIRGMRGPRQRSSRLGSVGLEILFSLQRNRDPL